jgi:hypothetical protein
VASEEAEKQFNKKATPHVFLPEQLVLLEEHSFLAKNKKLSPKWSGPHHILRIKGDCNVELLLLHNNKKLISHVNRLKPYFVPKPNAVASPDFFPVDKPATPPSPPVLPHADENILLPEDYNNYQLNPSPLREVKFADRSPQPAHTQIRACLQQRTSSSL